MSLFKITPKYLSSYVNLHFTDDNWVYNKDENLKIANVQAEGSAKIFNLLLDNKIALLADEVGMGKTYQALAAMVTLWRQKPDAKVLLYAPNEIVAKKWINDYSNFIRKNFRIDEDIVKSSLNRKPMRQPVYCKNQAELMEKINLKWPSFYVCKTSSLSGFLSTTMKQKAIDKLGLNLVKDVDEDSSPEEKSDWMYKLAMECNQKTYSNLSKNDQPPFDLLIFDEAHYLRRTEQNSTSNRSIAAHAFFAGRKIRSETPYADFQPLADKVLLMTATPNHSSNNDIRNIVSLFNPDYKQSKPEIILKKLCVRRFRRLANKTKHQYRDEQPEPVEMKSISEKLFFAAYQKSLVQYKARRQKDGEIVSNNPYRILFGYLEGFEFLPYSNNKTIEDKDSDNNKAKTGDFEKTEDALIINDLSKTFYNVYKKPPSHPKYEKTISNLSPEQNSTELVEKQLVFVRRIPSVIEIASRLVEKYDALFMQYFTGILSKKEIQNYNIINLRRRFYDIAKKDEENSELKELSKKEDQPDDNDDGIPKSMVLDLFTVKKEGKYRTTDCSNFRLRFVKNEQVFSVFFQPALNYIDKKYNVKQYLKNSNRRLFQSTVQNYRTAKVKSGDIKVILEQEFNLNNYPIEPTDAVELDTLIGIWYRIESYSEEKKKISLEAKRKYDSFSILEKEGFSSYLEAGLLFSSPYIFNFYAYYKSLTKRKQLKGIELYTKFCGKIESELEKSGLSSLISQSVLSFQQFYKKEVALTESKLLIEKWNFLKSTLPVYPFNGKTKRQSIVRAFNTPFYPNVLIATSVLQEGVDLHYHCSEVIHYGIAWTQGDNEQRVGRVDRLFGKLNNNLDVNNKTTLPIHYPYLKNTLDQEQIKRFIKRKHISESLLDQFKMVNNSKEIEFREKTDDDWEKYFNKPKKKVDISEPFGVTRKDFENITIPKKSNFPLQSLKDELVAVFNTVQNHFKDEFVYYQYDNNGDLNPLICAIKHVRRNDRNQPVLIELEYFEPGFSYIGKPTYLLKIKTPMGNNDWCFADLRSFGSLKQVYYSNPILKLNFSNETKGNFKYYISSELPVFIDTDGNLNLSENELITTIKNVISFADDLESKVCSSETDIENTIIKDSKSRLFNNGKYLKDDREPKTDLSGWEINDLGEYLFKTRDLRTEEIKETFLYNHKNALVRKIYMPGLVQQEVGLYNSDALPEELQLLEKVFNNTT